MRAGTFRLHHQFFPGSYNANQYWYILERQKIHYVVAVLFRVGPGYVIDMQIPACDRALRLVPFPTHQVFASQKNR